jgi:hypothetical protein
VPLHPSLHPHQHPALYSTRNKHCTVPFSRDRQQHSSLSLQHLSTTRLRSHVGRTCRCLLSRIIRNSNLVFAPRSYTIMLHILSLSFLLSATAVTPLGMGLSLATTLRVYLPSATCRAPTTCTITLLRSLADPGYVPSLLLPAAHPDLSTVAFLTSPTRNALPTEGRQTV